MPVIEPSEIARKYFVDDIPGASRIGTRLQGILAKIDAGKSISAYSLDYLTSNGMHSLCRLAAEAIDLETFWKSANEEREDRIEKSTVARVVLPTAPESDDSKSGEPINPIFNDPQYRRRLETRRLKAKYDIGYVERDDYPKLMRLLSHLDKGLRLTAEEALWLKTVDDDYWTSSVARAWHVIEAEAFTKKWHETINPWDAVTASSHWRRGGHPEHALSLTEEASSRYKKPKPKLASAIATTRGAALRALGRLSEAEAQGQLAHALVPNDFHPCTLLGAICMENGDVLEGHRWFTKAENLGANTREIIRDIRSLLSRLPAARRKQVEKVLLDEDPDRYDWLRPKR